MHSVFVGVPALAGKAQVVSSAKLAVSGDRLSGAGFNTRLKPVLQRKPKVPKRQHGTFGFKGSQCWRTSCDLSRGDAGVDRPNALRFFQHKSAANSGFAPRVGAEFERSLPGHRVNSPFPIGERASISGFLPSWRRHPFDPTVTFRRPGLQDRRNGKTFAQVAAASPWATQQISGWA
jgi:hypothetical protein